MGGDAVTGKRSLFRNIVWPYINDPVLGEYRVGRTLEKREKKLSSYDNFLQFGSYESELELRFYMNLLSIDEGCDKTNY